MVYVGSLDQDMKVPAVQSDTGAIFAEGYLLTRHRHGAARPDAADDRHELDLRSARGSLTR
jgi:hypothetical protein